MPSRNPKHNKKVYYERKKQFDSRKIPIKYFVMGLIFILSIAGVVLLAKYLPESPNGHGDKLYIEDGDTAELHYKLWKVEDIDDLDTSQEPFQESENFVTEVKLVPPEGGQGLIKGFYDELLDLEIGEINDFIIDKETDADSDGFDDDTGDEILGYADGQIYFFWVQVLNITKAEKNLPASSLDNIDLPVHMESISENYLICNVRELFSFEFLENY